MTPPEDAFTDALPKNLGGRPRKIEPDERTLKILEGLGAIQATQPEVCAVFGITQPTLRLFFRDFPDWKQAYEDGQGVGRMSLRRRQVKMSEKSAQMAIWLGKNWLGQADRIKQEHTGKDGGPIATVDLSKLSDQELDEYEALCLKLGFAPDISGGDPTGDPGGEGEEEYPEEPV